MEFPYGTLLERLPEGVMPPECWSEYGLLGGPSPICKKEMVGVEPKGMRWSLWPLTFEEYVSDTEPNRAASREGALALNRIVLWKRVNRKDIPPGWHAAKASWRADGFRELTNDYTATWSQSARRNLKDWKQRSLGKTHDIVDLTDAEFETAYLKSTARRKAGSELLHALKRRLALPERQGHTMLWGVRERTGGRIVAGTAALFSPTMRASMRECPFILPEARTTDAATGLMDHWFQESLARGMHTLFFMAFWFPGEPLSWKGPSEFKSHFGLRYVAYPPLLWHGERGTLW